MSNTRTRKTFPSNMRKGLRHYIKRVFQPKRPLCSQAREGPPALSQPAAAPRQPGPGAGSGPAGPGGGGSLGSRSCSRGRGIFHPRRPPPRLAPALAPRFFVLGKRIPEGGCASSSTRPLQFWDGRVFVWSAEEAPLVCFSPPDGHPRVCKVPRGGGRFAYGGLQSCPGAVRAPRQQRKGDPTGAAGKRTVSRT